MINGFIGAAGKSIATTSHSLKSTTLVWWARYGIDATSRAMLGHHSIKDKSLACYSRDLLARPLRELCGMLMKIRLGHFKPDGTRSGYMQVGKQHAVPEGECARRSRSVPSPSLASDWAEFEAAKAVDVSALPSFDPSNPFQREGTEAFGHHGGACRTDHRS